MPLNNLPRVIGLTGYKQSGKDTVCAIIQKHFPYYERLAFADAVREEAQSILDGVTPIPSDMPAELTQLYMDQFAENTLMNHDELRPVTVYDRPYTPRIRAILQQHGTEYRRAQDPNYWVDAWAAAATMPAVIATDVRFPNEVEMIRKHGGVIWRVWRGQPAIEDLHESEQHIMEITPECIINNICTLAELEARVLYALVGAREVAAA